MIKNTCPCCRNKITNINPCDNINDNCSICLIDSRSYISCEPCKHTFHKKCITKWWDYENYHLNKNSIIYRSIELPLLPPSPIFNDKRLLELLNNIDTIFLRPSIIKIINKQNSIYNDYYSLTTPIIKKIKNFKLEEIQELNIKRLQILPIDILNLLLKLLPKIKLIIQHLYESNNMVGRSSGVIIESGSTIPRLYNMSNNLNDLFTYLLLFADQIQPILKKLYNEYIKQLHIFKTNNIKLIEDIIVIINMRQKEDINLLEINFDNTYHKNKIQYLIHGIFLLHREIHLFEYTQLNEVILLYQLLTKKN